MRSNSLQFSSEYDAIIIGAGHNGLTCGCYLAKAGLRVLVLEEYHAIGGMTITEEITLPGFKSDIHAFGYQLANTSPVPKELGLDRFGFELIYPEISFSHIFPDGQYISMYRSLQKTIKSIQKFSVKDAQTWRTLFNKYLVDREKIFSSINSPPSYLDISSAIEYRKQLQSMRSWCDENFETDEVKVLFGTSASFVGLSPNDAGGGELCHIFAAIAQDKGNNVVRGGFVNLPLALARFIESKGGDIITNASVTKIIIDNSRAVGVGLANGKNISARKLVVSSIDPSTLILDLIGEDYIDSSIIKDIKRIEWGDSVFGIYLALNGNLKYRSDQEEVGSSSQIHLSPPSLEYFSKAFYESRSGIIPNNPPFILSNESIIDPTRISSQKRENRQLVKILIPSVPYDIRDSGPIHNDHNSNPVKIKWPNIQEQYSNHIIDIIADSYILNLKDIILKEVSYSPVDYEKRLATCVKGTLSCGAVLPYQSGSMRPVPQLSNYKIPSLRNVYLCGSGSHPGPGVSMAPGRNAAQVILSDLEK